ncbi:hypothetical protein ACFX15_018076 [Malus domestica]
MGLRGSSYGSPSRGTSVSRDRDPSDSNPLCFLPKAQLVGLAGTSLGTPSRDAIEGRDRGSEIEITVGGREVPVVCSVFGA